MSFLGAKLDVAIGQWWGILIAIGVLGSLPMQLQSRWSIARRKTFEPSFQANTDSANDSVQ